VIKEPARIIAGITAFVTAVIAVFVAFGLGLDESQQKAILGVIAPTVVLIGLAGELIRARVVSPATAAEAVAVAKQEPAATRAVPRVEVAGYRKAVAAHLGRPASALEFRPVVDGELG
jgi:hypothetical protein